MSSAPGPRVAPRASIHRAISAGFLLLFVLAFGFAWTLNQRLNALEQRAASVQARFAESEGLLLTVGGQLLLGTVYVRDALLESDPVVSASYLEELGRAQARIEQALQQYVAADESLAQRVQWQHLRDELNSYWKVMLPALDPGASRDPEQTRAWMLNQVIPRRRTIIHISDEIRTLNRETYERRSAEVAMLYEDLRRSIWRAGALAAALGLFIAVAAIRYAWSLESRLRQQRQLEAEQKREVERLSAQLVRAQEEERRTLARELHDEVGQALTAIKLELADADRRRRAGDTSDDLLAGARAMTDSAMDAVRDVSQLLNPALLETLGLKAALEGHLARFSERTGIRTSLETEGLDDRVAAPVEICAYRVVQEALTNVVKHAQATSCCVTLTRSERALVVRVEDDGLGMTETPKPTAGLGLVGIRERAASLGGSFTVDSRPGAGTRLVVTQQVEAPAAAAGRAHHDPIAGASAAPRPLEAR